MRANGNVSNNGRIHHIDKTLLFYHATHCLLKTIKHERTTRTSILGERPGRIQAGRNAYRHT
jgi:hypothetical protein